MGVARRTKRSLSRLRGAYELDSNWRVGYVDTMVVIASGYVTPNQGDPDTCVHTRLDAEGCSPCPTVALHLSEYSLATRPNCDNYLKVDHTSKQRNQLLHARVTPSSTWLTFQQASWLLKPCVEWQSQRRTSL